MLKLDYTAKDRRQVPVKKRTQRSLIKISHTQVFLSSLLKINDIFLEKKRKTWSGMFTTNIILMVIHISSKCTFGTMIFIVMIIFKTNVINKNIPIKLI